MLVSRIKREQVNHEFPKFPVVMRVGGEIDAVTVRLNAKTF